MKSATLLSDRVSTAGTVPAFRLFGVPVRFHFTFLLFVVFLIVNDFASKEGGGTFALFVLGLFASVLLHELAHSLTAAKLGVRTTEIVMFPIGGVSRMERLLRPSEELWISVAGPLMNLLLAAALFGFLAYGNGSMPIKVADIIAPSDANVLPRLAYGNLLLAFFNLIPAFPMDGGRILRALLSFIRTEEEATRIAAWMGRMLAISICLYGLLYGQYMWVFIAIFIYLGAAQEGAAALGRTLTHGIPVRGGDDRGISRTQPRRHDPACGRPSALYFPTGFSGRSWRPGVGVVKSQSAGEGDGLGRTRCICRGRNGP